MPEPKGTNPPQTGVPQYNYGVEEGTVVNLFEGLSPDELAQIQGELQSDETLGEGGENAATESEQADIPQEQAPPVDRKEPEKPPEAEPTPTPESAKAPEPAPLKLKVKRHGQETELDLSNDPDRLNTLVQLGYDYQAKTSELAREREWLQAHKAIWESEDFQGFLAEKRAEGKFLPQAPPAVEPQALSEYAIRQLDPDFDRVREKMSAVVMNMDPEVERAVRTNHAAFVRLYDRVAQDFRKAPAPPETARTPAPPAQPQAPPPDAEAARRILANKEVLKDRGKVETPGAVSEPPSDEARWRKTDALLAKRFRESKSDEDAVALVMHRRLLKI